VLKRSRRHRLDLPRRRTASDPFKPAATFPASARSARHGPRGDAFRAHRRRDEVLSGVLEFKLSDYWRAQFRPISFTSIAPTTGIAFVESRHQSWSIHDGGALQLRRRRQGYDSRSAIPSASASRSAATPATMSPRSTPGIRGLPGGVRLGRAVTTTTLEAVRAANTARSFWGHERRWMSAEKKRSRGCSARSRRKRPCGPSSAAPTRQYCPGMVGYT